MDIRCAAASILDTSSRHRFKVLQGGPGVRLAVLSSADDLYVVTLWRRSRNASSSAWGPLWPPVPHPRLRQPRSSCLTGAGSVPIAGWSLGGVGPGRVFGGEEEGGGARSGPGEARTILLLHMISASPSRPSKQPLIVCTFLKV